jgi:hypothetical protein
MNSEGPGRVKSGKAITGFIEPVPPLEKNGTLSQMPAATDRSDTSPVSQRERTLSVSGESKMDAANHQPNYAHICPIEQNTRAGQKEGTMTEHSLPLPVAMRVEEISDRDVDVLLRIAEDRNASSGRLKHTPRRIPLRERAEDAKATKS